MPIYVLPTAREYTTGERNRKRESYLPDAEVSVKYMSLNNHTLLHECVGLHISIHVCVGLSPTLSEYKWDKI